jgi:hypothetical protein
MQQKTKQKQKRLCLKLTSAIEKSKAEKEGRQGLSRYQTVSLNREVRKAFSGKVKFKLIGNFYQLHMSSLACIY